MGNITSAVPQAQTFDSMGPFFPTVLMPDSKFCPNTQSELGIRKIAIRGQNNTFLQRYKNGTYNRGRFVACPDCDKKPVQDHVFDLFSNNAADTKKTFTISDSAGSEDLCLAMFKDQYLYFLPCDRIKGVKDLKSTFTLENGTSVAAFGGSTTFITYACDNPTSDEACAKQNNQTAVFDLKTGVCRERKATDCPPNQTFENGACRNREGKDCQGKALNPATGQCIDVVLPPQCEAHDPAMDQTKNAETGWASCAKCKPGYVPIYDHKNFAFCVRETPTGNFANNKYSAMYFTEGGKYWCPAVNNKDEGTQTNTLHLKPCHEVDWNDELSLHPTEIDIYADKGRTHLASYSWILEDPAKQQGNSVYLRITGDGNNNPNDGNDNDRQLTVSNNRLIYKKNPQRCADVYPCKDANLRCPVIVSMDMSPNCKVVGFATINKK